MLAYFKSVVDNNKQTFSDQVYLLTQCTNSLGSNGIEYIVKLAADFI